MIVYNPSCNIFKDRGIFAAKRKEQIETANKILGLNDYAKQYKIVQMLMETVFPVSEVGSVNVHK